MRAVLPVLLLLVTLAACGGGGSKLDAAKLTLELGYPPAGMPTAVLTGQPGAAEGGASVTCRLSTLDKRKLGQTTAADDGSFEAQLDNTAFPLAAVPHTTSAINALVECRAGDGKWVHPLRPPRVEIG